MFLLAKKQKRVSILAHLVAYTMNDFFLEGLGVTKTLLENYVAS